MKRIVLIACLFISAGVVAQDQQKIVGKWQVVAIQDNRMQYDFITDSFSTKKQSANPIENKAAADSLEMLGKELFKSMFSNAFFEFNADNSFRNEMNLNTKDTGTFLIDEMKKVLILTINKTGKVSGKKKVVEEKYRYVFRGERLALLAAEPEDDDEFSIEFEKQ